MHTEDHNFPIVLDLTGIIKKISDKYLLKLTSNNPELKFENQKL